MHTSRTLSSDRFDSAAFPGSDMELVESSELDTTWVLAPDDLAAALNRSHPRPSGGVCPPAITSTCPGGTAHSPSGWHCAQPVDSTDGDAPPLIRGRSAGNTKGTQVQPSCLHAWLLTAQSDRRLPSQGSPIKIACFPTAAFGPTSSAHRTPAKSFNDMVLWGAALLLVVLPVCIRGVSLSLSSAQFAVDPSLRAPGQQSCAPRRLAMPHYLQLQATTKTNTFGLRSPKKKPLTLMLDLDKTVLYGNDGNDLGVALQWMDRATNADTSNLEELYALLVNKNLREMYDSYRERGYEVNVVIYTRRPTILTYTSVVNNHKLDARYADEWHSDDQIYFPSSVRSSDDIFATYSGPVLHEDDKIDMKFALDRLVAARNAVMLELGLEMPPPVVVTATPKNVEATARHLLLSPETCLLFDDNPELRHNPRVVSVDGFTTLPTAQRDAILAFMARELPAKELELSQLAEDLVQFLDGAPLEDRAITRDDTGNISWWIPEATSSKTASWRTPDPVLEHLSSVPFPVKSKGLRLQLEEGLETELSDVSYDLV